MKTGIAITGMCVLSGAGETASILCEQSVSGKATSSKVDLQAYENTINSIDTGSHELYRIQKLLLAAFLKASHMAKLSSGLVRPEQTGVFLGNSYGLEGFKAEFFRCYKKSEPALTRPTLFPFTNANALASWLAIQIEAKGPNLTFVNGCTSSSEAALAARDALTYGECDVAFVGGVNLADHDLSDEFYASGFKYESAGMLVLEKINSMDNSKRKPLAFLRDFQSGTLTQGQLQKVKSEKSISSINNAVFNRFKACPVEIINLGNNLGESAFHYNKRDFEITKEKRKILSFGDAVGNIFDVAGVFGAALSVEFLNVSNLSHKSIIFSNIDSSGHIITMLIERE